MATFRLQRALDHCSTGMVPPPALPTHTHSLTLLHHLAPRLLHTLPTPSVRASAPHIYNMQTASTGSR